MEGVVNYPRSKTPSIALYFTSIPLNDPSSVKLQSEKRKADRSMHDRSFQIPASSTTLRRESFYPRTIREWNSLSANVATAGSLGSWNLQGPHQPAGISDKVCFYLHL